MTPRLKKNLKIGYYFGLVTFVLLTAGYQSLYLVTHLDYDVNELCLVDWFVSD